MHIADTALNLIWISVVLRVAIRLFTRFKYLLFIVLLQMGGQHVGHWVETQFITEKSSTPYVKQADQGVHKNKRVPLTKDGYPLLQPNPWFDKK